MVSKQVTFTPLSASAVWSCVAYLPHAITFFYVLYDMSCAWYAYALLVLLGFFFFIPTTLWFLLLVRARVTDGYTFIFCVTASVYSWVINYVACLVMGQAGGYPLAFPLLPVVVACPKLATTVWCGGRWFLLFCVYVLQISFLHHKKHAVLVLLLLAGWYTVHLCAPQPVAVSDVMRSVIPVYTRQGLAQLACAQDALRKAVEQYPHARAYLLPESVVPFDHEKIPYLATLLTDEVGCRRKPVLFGAHLCQEGKMYNSIAIAHDGRITIGYVKKRLVPFFESFHHLELLYKQAMVLTPATAFYPGPSLQEPLYIPDVGYVLPLICSEAFEVFSYESQFPLLVIVHDAHFRYRYFKKLMQACAQVQAGARSVPLIYSSYG